MEHLFTADSIISFVILVILEVVLGIDNVIFVSLSLNRLKNAKDQRRARRIWMITGIISRSILLFALSWLLQQKEKRYSQYLEKDLILPALL
jgi:predicted tellurium resistance membrane protein TerC